MAIKRNFDIKLKPDKDIEKIKETEKPFSKINFWMMGGCVILIILGYLFMSGGGGTDGEFNPDIFSTRRIVVGPLLSFLGFLLMAFAIIYNPGKKGGGILSFKKEKQTTETTPTQNAD